MNKTFTLKLILLLALNVFSSPSPSQSGQPGQPAAGSMSTPIPGSVGTKSRSKFKNDRRADPTLLNNLWRSKTPLGNAEVYIVLALLIGFITVVIGCWLSDNCWSPEPDPLVTIA